MDNNFGLKSNQPELLPPIYKTPPGRPKKLRRMEADEHVSDSKLSNKNLIMKCSKCKQLGHNIRSYRKGIRHRKVRTQSVPLIQFFCRYNNSNLNL